MLTADQILELENQLAPARSQLVDLIGVTDPVQLEPALKAIANQVLPRPADIKIIPASQPLHHAGHANSHFHQFRLLLEFSANVSTQSFGQELCSVGESIALRNLIEAHFPYQNHPQGLPIFLYEFTGPTVLEISLPDSTSRHGRPNPGIHIHSNRLQFPTDPNRHSVALALTELLADPNDGDLVVKTRLHDLMLSYGRAIWFDLLQTSERAQYSAAVQGVGQNPEAHFSEMHAADRTLLGHRIRKTHGNSGRYHLVEAEFGSEDVQKECQDLLRKFHHRLASK
jgi:hypothetical protein